jgi:hypothetical protein
MRLLTIVQRRELRQRRKQEKEVYTKPSEGRANAWLTRTRRTATYTRRREKHEAPAQVSK